MKIIIKQETNQIKGGWAARAVGTTAVAFGPSPALARRGLERTVLNLFRPFERDGTLADELTIAGITAEDDGGDLNVVFDEQELLMQEGD
jgi:hypothetical protein